MDWSSGKKYTFLALFAFWVIAITAAGAWAQSGTTSLRGTVTDKSGAAVSGAKITLSNPDQALNRQATSGSEGEYEFIALPPGTYTLTVEASGFRKFEQNKLQLLVNSPATLNVKLEIGTALQTVEVVAQTEKLNTTDASLGVAFSETQVKSLPLEGGNVPDLLSLQAGVAYTGNRTDVNLNTDTRSGAVNGARSDQSNITLDGIDVNTDTKGYAFQSVLPITVDSVQEFRVTTTNYNADEGRSSGAQVSLVTKGGTNDFHGSLFEIHRNTLTSANDYFVKLAQLGSGQPNEAPKLIRNIFGGSIGGPIKKDRLFFFANYQGGRQREAQSVVRVVPSAAMRDGVITYQCADPTQCRGGTVQGLTGPHTIAAGNFGVSPSQIKAMDPLGIGVSTGVMVPYLNSFPLPNDPSVEDGVNFEGFRFKGPVAISTNWYIARADYKISGNGNHTLYWRGALRNDKNAGVPYLLGGSPELTLVDYSKGFSIGYTAVLKPTLVNNFRYGYTRQSFGQIGNQVAPIVFFRGLNDNQTSNNSSFAVTNNSNYQVPVNNIVDDVSWVRGKHTWQFGANFNYLRNPQSNNLNSFSSATTNASWFDTAALAESGQPGHFDPNFEGLPAIDSGFDNAYDYPMIALVGMVSQVNAQYNFNKNGSALPQGAPVSRRFGADAWEMYAQDSWKVKPNLTVTAGLRYSLFSPPWETNGIQVAPNISLSDWFNLRGQNAMKGLGSNQTPPLSFNLAGPANGKPGFYNWDKKDFGPRLAVAWSPNFKSGLLGSIFGGPGKTSIRAGAGIVYDRLGPSLLATFDSNGSFGLSTALTNTGGVQTPASAPRITGLNAIPTTDNTGTPIFAPAPTSTFPQTFPSGSAVGAYAVYWGMDNKIRTPSSYTLDLSVGRELGHDFSLEVSYVGRLSRRLLTQSDLAMPINLVDPKTGVDYFTAVKALANIYRTGVKSENVTDAMIGPTASYWTDLMAGTVFVPGSQGFRASRCASSAFPTKDAAIAAYDLFCGFKNNETTALQGIDQAFGFRDFSMRDANGNRIPYFPATGQNTFVDPQFAALDGWRSMASATYHALQVSLRKHVSHGVQFDLNYTYSKSIDISSDANRINAYGGLGGQVINSWAPNLLRAVSDFDLTHQLNANWIIDLPFGKGRWIGRDSRGALDAVIGGWQLTGLARWTSGFAVGVGNGAQWPTNWELSGYATQIAAVTTHGAVKTPDGKVNLFGDQAARDAAHAAFAPDFPGQTGNRNNLRGDGFAGLDLGLSKRWKMPYSEGHSVQFRWEVFNALNLTRFDVQSMSLSLTRSSSFGNYTGLLTNPRVMQFALRYEF
ncbi:MAG TPA: TonB-dependent receptor [Candidatus Acidoferrum sp.]|nr:TonB-dependent receptor [Candidatus Acidoferrum sp.]